MRRLVMISTLIAAVGLMACGDSDNDPVMLGEQDPDQSSEDPNQSSEDPNQSSEDPNQSSEDPNQSSEDPNQSSEDSNHESENNTETPPEESGIAALGAGQNDLDAVEVKTITDADDGLAGPRDLEFNPESPDQLWVVNRDDDSVVILFDPGTDQQSSQKYAGMGNDHYMPNVSALAFGEPGFMATAQQTVEATQPTTPEDFMGPTLWTTDLAIFNGGHASHMDMLHNSPLGSGIAWDDGIAFWYFDAYHGSLTHYDFVEDHGPGGADHSDGVVHRYADGEVSGVDEIVSHLAYDRESGLLYAADTGNSRIAVLDTTTGETGGPIQPNYDGSTQTFVNGAELTTLIDGVEEGINVPAGLELHDDLLYITDAETSVIYAFDTDGEIVDYLDVSSVIAPGALMGLTIDDEGRIYAADSEAQAILRFAENGE